MGTRNFELEVDPNDKIEFEGAADQPIKVELKIKNTTDSSQAVKVKCTDNDLFRIRPPTGLVKSKDTITVNVTFNPPADKQQPKGQHHFVILHTKQGDAKNARAAFEKDPGTSYTKHQLKLSSVSKGNVKAPGDHRKTIPVEFKLKEKEVEKEDEKEEEKKDDEKEEKKGKDGKESEKKGKEPEKKGKEAEKKGKEEKKEKEEEKEKEDGKDEEEGKGDDEEKEGGEEEKKEEEEGEEKEGDEKGEEEEKE